MAYRFQFKLEGLPKTTNALGRMHWGAPNAEAKYWKKQVWLKVLSMNGRPPKPLKHARLTLVRNSSKEPDYDGLVSSFKRVIDGLVVAEVLQDDNPNVIGVPHYVWKKSVKSFIEITVEEI